MVGLSRQATCLLATLAGLLLRLVLLLVVEHQGPPTKTLAGMGVRVGAKAAPGLLQNKVDLLEVWMVETGAIMTPQVMQELAKALLHGSLGRQPGNFMLVAAVVALLTTVL